MSETDNKYLHKLIKQLELDQLDRDLFIGEGEGGRGRLFGGFVAAQSVVAAYRTIETDEPRDLHSLHAYFLRPGKRNVPIRYVVYRIRDGKSFTTRDVVAYQSGEAIFNLSASFVKREEGLAYQESMPEAPDPEGLPHWDAVRPDRRRRREEDDEHHRWHRERPIDIVACDRPEDLPRGATPPPRRVWIRVRGTLPDDPTMHAALMTYATDSGLMSTGRPPDMPFDGGFGASLDHAVWFHRPPRFDDWLLFTSEAPVAAAGRALVYGAMWSRDGTRVASVAQEGLHRYARKD
ncbi:MAG: acyl-CoA thioesterase II [Dehalococcoidia bacterium]